MEKLPMCRICLVVKAPMYLVVNKNLQDIYERLTDIPFVTQDRRPMLACSFCYTKLIQTGQLQKKCLAAEDLFTKMSCNNYELHIPLCYPGQLEYRGGLKTTPIEHMSIADEWEMETLETIEYISENDNSPCQDDCVSCVTIPLKKEHQSTSNQDNIDIKMERENGGKFFKEVLDQRQEGGGSQFDNMFSSLAIMDKFRKYFLADFKKRGGATDEKKPTRNLPKANLEDKITVKQEKNEPSGSNLIRTAQSKTTNPDSQCKESTKIFEIHKQIHKHSGEKPYKCQICQKHFSRSPYLKRHLQTHTGEKPYKCAVCQRAFRLKNLLNIHCRIHTGEKPYNCKFCHKTFSQAAHLKHHVLTHTGEKPFKCDSCQCSYRTKAYLKNHMRIHTGEKPYKCDICQRYFISRPMLKTHIALHSCVKPYECDICHRGFNIKSNLNMHIRIHTGEKPYKCDVCQLSFVQKHALNIHVRNKHTGEKPYKCDVCLRSFSAMSVLKNHLTTHSGEKPYKCDLCQLRFKRKDNLQNHILTHSNEKQYQCEICAKCFRQASTLNSHLWVHKKEKQ